MDKMLKVYIKISEKIYFLMFSYGENIQKVKIGLGKTF